MMHLYPKPPMVGHRRSSNIKDSIVRATISYPPEPKTTPIKKAAFKNTCQISGCEHCKMLHKKNGYIRSMVTRVTYKVHSQVHCQTTNLVYCLTCPKCHVQYVGETKRTMQVRYKEHIADIKNNRNKPVSSHFLGSPHRISDLVPTILESCKSKETEEETTTFRRLREKYWIYKLRSLNPCGLNVMG